MAHTIFEKQLIRALAKSCAAVEVSTATSRMELDDDPDLTRQAQELVESWYRKDLEIGRKQGVEEGIKRSLIAIYEMRLGAIPERLRAAIDGTRDEATLLDWIKIVGTRSADEIAAAIDCALPG